VCIGQATDPLAPGVEAVAGGSLFVFVVCYREVTLAVVRVDFHMMIALAVLEVALRNMIDGAYLAYSAGSWAENRVARWHIACCHSPPRWVLLIRRHHRLEEVSSPGVRSALAQLALPDYMPSARAGVIVDFAAVAVQVVEERPLLRTAPIRVGLGMNVLKRCFLLEDGSVCRLQSFPAVGLQDSWSRGVRPSLL